MSMIVCKDIAQLRAQLNAWRKNNESIAFVPTMGNLHAGHLSLIKLAQQHAARVVVSIYVNPLQFSPGEDFSSYPRTLSEDLEKLKVSATDLVFTPDTSLVYPDGEQHSSFVEVPALSHIIEGEFRPGFFRGVATVVLKLLNMVQPDYAVFGEKDFQQLLVIRRMVKDLNLPVEIIGGEIKREADGLAMSSRNNYLNAAEREKSRFLFAALHQCCKQLEQDSDIEQARIQCMEQLQNHGFTVDYVTLRETSALGEVSNADIVGYQAGYQELIILAAAKMGGTRLIDNVKFSLKRRNLTD